MRLTFAPNQFGRLRMKSRYAVLLVMAIFTGLILSQKAIAGDRPSRGHPGGQSPMSGSQFSTTAQGFIAICLNSTTFAEESCSTAGAIAVPFGVLNNGVLFTDDEGNSCSSVTEVDSVLPSDVSPPTVTVNENSVGKQLSYDPTTQTGDTSFTAYTGGACTGATFDSTGATELSSGTVHFVITNNGNRIDFIATKLTNSIGSIGDFSLSGTDLRQTR
jgi:hypothetical protein